MKRVIVDYQKLNEDILNLLVEKFPDGYDDSDIISFKNAKNELVEAVEVKTEDTVYLVKVGVRLAQAMENYIEEDDDVADDDLGFEEVKAEDTDVEDEVDEDDDND
ncbi:conserved hypothetical protein [Formosa agariphila KMM 3901]|uniref:DNA primase n=1 Tax=Formosa agariphila (strain DSM 15362 / KCTC 12365 / LMG 23005 / KMM 3901 / M-2Alg 35-1) TaxID=1347342 RepID=T2KPP9_FORAG|nr:hypothetical protein [Formosa agariphila]CDF80720.1 conserved hypothetical protein [Formosa agariphila KMM 3901]